MPIEIRELVIKATVVQDQKAEATNPPGDANAPQNPKEEMVALCVEKVLEILKHNNER